MIPKGAPKTIRVAGHDYQIEWKDEQWTEDSESHGDCYPPKLRIRLCADDRWPETLWHEVGHAIWHEYSIDQLRGEESINTAYMRGVHQVLADNPKMRLIVGNPT